MYLEKEEYRAIATQMLTNISGDMFQHPRYHSNWGILLIHQIINPVEFVITGPTAEERRKELEQHYLPMLIIAGSIRESSLPLLRNRHNSKKTWLYVCQNNRCKLPVETIEEALSLFPNNYRGNSQIPL